MSVFVHPSSIVDEGALLDEGVQVWHFCHVSGGAHLGAGVVLGQSVYIAPGVEVGAGSRIQNNVSLYQGVHLDEEVFCGPSVVFTNVTTPRAHVSRKNDFRETPVGRRATLGANATIVCGHAIGAYAFIAAGAVVTEEVAPHALVMGNPARRRGWVCACGEVLRPGAPLHRCERCGNAYEEKAGVLSLVEGVE